MGTGSMAAAGFSAALVALACTACTSIAADSRTFEGTRWHVTAIDGRPTPAAGDYWIAFSDDEVSGRFGCNGFGGGYRITGETLTASAIRSTMMACSDPAASFEAQGFAVLNRPMQMHWTSGSSLTLGNGAGSIALERVSP